MHVVDNDNNNNNNHHHRIRSRVVPSNIITSRQSRFRATPVALSLHVMPSRILNFGRTCFSPTSDHSIDETLARKSPTTENKPAYPGMDLFHHTKEKRHSLTGGGRVSPAPKSSPKNSPRIGPVKSAKLEFDVESPPLVVYGTPSTSSGALFSGQLLLTVLDPEIELKTFEMSLIATVTTKKPVSKDCPNCATKTNELKKWVYLTEPTRLPKVGPSCSIRSLDPVYFCFILWSLDDFEPLSWP